MVSRQRSAWLWALLAFAGVALLGLTQQHFGGVDPSGLAFAAGAAAAWAGYILASARAGAELPRLDGLAVATVLGALAVAPVAALTVDFSASAQPHVLGTGLIVALLSSTIPYSLELLSLRRLSAETFAVLTSLSPVTAVLAGWLVLSQHLGVASYLAILLVSVACAGAARSSHKR